MKKLFRLVTVVLLVGGWGIATMATQVIRTPSHFVLLTKDHLDYRDTYLDTRAWTTTEDKAHPALVEHLIELNKADELAHTVPPVPGVDTKTQLATLMVMPGVASATPGPTPLDKAATAGQRIGNDLRTVFK